MRLFNQLSIKVRLLLVIALLGIELVIGAAVGLFSLGQANDELQSLYSDRLVRLGQLDQIVRRLNRNQFDVSEALTANAGDVPALLDDIERNNVVIDEQWKAYAAAGLAGREQEAANRFLEARAAFVERALQPAVDALRAADLERARQVVHGPLVELFSPAAVGIDALIQLQLDEARKSSEASRYQFEVVRVVCLGGMILGLLLASVVGVVLVRSIVVPLEQAVRIAGAVADGDLTREIRVQGHDETSRLMQALSNMNEGLAAIVGRVRGGTDTIATASSQIAAGNLDLSARTEQQAASLEQTAASMEELTSTVRQNADNARQANGLAQSASAVANKGGQVVAKVVDTMAAIDASAARIGDITGVIDGIAFQTNILALNAAVEAARAGEQGRGFAVVANEVRSLAQRSAAAAREIKTLVDDSVRTVSEGSLLVEQAGATMEEIVRSVGRVTDIMAEILAASQEQTIGIEQVNQAIIQMDHATQQNAALVEQASAAAQALREEADSLAQAVGTFRLRAQVVRGAAAADHASEGRQNVQLLAHVGKGLAAQV
ncbi:methyl-accepting chemotaxis protein [Massilia sp. BSC265]|uniref:methyl-accepting chemotaxis protein n=1 Tax=Massilia sp. BSC265 TaxID=1549812 RepID=UPI0009DF8622|nr:methyl-accepting chemotaxis protein [Massilia sp. BSC265]